MTFISNKQVMLFPVLIFKKFTYLKEKHSFIVPLIYAFTGWFLYVP